MSNLDDEKCLNDCFERYKKAGNPNLAVPPCVRECALQKCKDAFRFPEAAEECIVRLSYQTDEMNKCAIACGTNKDCATECVSKYGSYHKQI